LLLDAGSPVEDVWSLVPDCIGVLALDVGVLARVVGVVALDVLPSPGCRLRAIGELERVDEGLDESSGPLIFRTDRGNLDDEGGSLGSGEFGFRVAGLRAMRWGGGLRVDASLWDREDLVVGADTDGGFVSVFPAALDQLPGDGRSTSGSERLR
jgi:hypothetical protein